MVALKDILLGFLTYVLSVGALIAVMLACFWLWGPPTVDRGRSYTFVAGGGALLMVVMILGFLITVVASSWRS